MTWQGMCSWPYPMVLSKLQKWGDYTSFGEPVLPSRFIPMKTPLSPSLIQNDRFENVLTLPVFLADQRAKGRTVVGRCRLN